MKANKSLQLTPRCGVEASALAPLNCGYLALDGGATELYVRPTHGQQIASRDPRGRREERRSQ